MSWADLVAVVGAGVAIISGAYAAFYFMVSRQSRRWEERRRTELLRAGSTITLQTPALKRHVQLVAIRDVPGLVVGEALDLLNAQTGAALKGEPIPSREGISEEVAKRSDGALAVRWLDVTEGN